MLAEDPGRTGRRLIPAGPRTPTMSRRFGLLLVCCVLLAACSAGSAASSSPASGVTLAGTFTDDGFQASDYYGNACALVLWLFRGLMAGSIFSWVMITAKN